jgi:Mg-chelatase subunit ChlD
MVMNRHRRISLLLALLMFVIIIMLLVHSRGAAQSKGCLKADVIVLVDVSGSIDGYEDQIHLALVGFVDGLDISEEGIRAGIIAFADNATTLCPLTGDHDTFDDTFKRVRSDNGSTNMKEGVIAVLDEYSQRGRPDAVKVVIVISDGATQFQAETLRLLESLSLIQALVCSVLIKNTVSDVEFMKQVGGNCYLETDYGQLYKELERLDFCL